MEPSSPLVIRVHGRPPRTVRALEDHFRYDPDAYSMARDASLMITEIQWGRPVQLAGADSLGGHSWVVCGYNTDPEPDQFRDPGKHVAVIAAAPVVLVRLAESFSVAAGTPDIRHKNNIPQARENLGGISPASVQKTGGKTGSGSAVQDHQERVFFCRIITGRFDKDAFRMEWRA